MLHRNKPQRGVEDRRRRRAVPGGAAVGAHGGSGGRRAGGRGRGAEVLRREASRTRQSPAHLPGPGLLARRAPQSSPACAVSGRKWLDCATLSKPPPSSGGEMQEQGRDSATVPPSSEIRGLSVCLQSLSCLLSFRVSMVLSTGQAMMCASGFRQRRMIPALILDCLTCLISDPHVCSIFSRLCSCVSVKCSSDYESVCSMLLNAITRAPLMQRP